MLLSFFGAAPDTGNLGVTALCYATLYNFSRKDQSAEFTVFDYGRGREKRRIDFGIDQTVHFHRQGAIHSRRFYRPENLQIIKLFGLLGGLGNPGIRTIKQSDAVLDISGGDSFTDLYGPWRFRSVILPKLIAIQQRIPLVLLPQTYGPFASSKNEMQASTIVKQSMCTWARDARSFEVLKHLLGSSYDPARHQCGVDIAFGLPAFKPSSLPASLEKFLEKKNKKIGINVSGLIYNDFKKSKKQFGFKADYRQAILNILKRFLTETDCIIALVPHVVTPRGHYESDTDACHDVVDRLGDQGRERVAIVPEYDNPCAIKWVISQFDWFCGTRMHAAIAALSSAVPVSAISYSPKTLGVFETCGQGQHVADPQKMDEYDLVENLWDSWKNRRNAILQYKNNLPGVKLRVKEQVLSILEAIRE